MRCPSTARPRDLCAWEGTGHLPQQRPEDTILSTRRAPARRGWPARAATAGPRGGCRGQPGRHFAAGPVGACGPLARGSARQRYARSRLAVARSAGSPPRYIQPRCTRFVVWKRLALVLIEVRRVAEIRVAL